MSDTDIEEGSVAEDGRPVTLGSRGEYERLLGEPPVLLEFVTPGCGICAPMEPVLGNVARVAPGVVAIADATTVPELAAEYASGSRRRWWSCGTARRSPGWTRGSSPPGG
jgi:thiol-disulfide isomerase/thioredoxin